MKLVWSDEFDYTGLPDSSKWSYEFGSTRGLEKQFYTEARRQNVNVRNGFLEITARKEKYVNPIYAKLTGSKMYPPKYRSVPRDSLPASIWSRFDSVVLYTSASLHTRGKADWKYGRIEIRAKLPAGNGVWPALWMMGSNVKEVGWPKCGEIDIMEFVGRSPDFIHSNVHFLDPVTDLHKSNEGKISLNREVSKGFHIYKMEWDAETISFFLDGERYHTFLIKNTGISHEQNPFNKPAYLLMNLALGGRWGGTIDDSNLPQTFYIDYVRVYQ